jgi:hypothetical protein
LITQLDTPLAVLTPLGPAWIYFVGAGGDEVEWQVFIVATGESWWFTNQYIRREPSITGGTGAKLSPIACPPGLEKHVERYRSNGWLPRSEETP